MSLVSRTVVAQQMLEALQIALETGTPEIPQDPQTVITILAYDEQAPDQDDPVDNTPTRWVKPHWPSLGELKRTPRAGMTDHRSFTMTLSVGVAEAELATDRYRLSKDHDLVVEAARSIARTVTEDGVETSVTVKSVDPDTILAPGDHPRTTTGVITLSGTAQARPAS